MQKNRVITTGCGKEALIMSIVHHPDTPVSSGSPSSLGIDNDGKNDELFKRENNCSSPSNSLSSSPSVTPNLSFTPPMNGILTPPNDVNDVHESAKSNQGSGRLKFYKDGILCLELTHQDEGVKRKWVQINTKTIFPTMIHAKKEVSIPRHASPTPSFHSPLSASSYQQRIESSASHTSDESSMLSSPRVKESCWRKPLPQRGISLKFEFFFKSALCIQKLRQNNCKPKLQRRPYKQFDMQNIHALCSCKMVKTNEKNELITCEERLQISRIKQISILETIVEKLRTSAEQRIQFSKSSPKQDFSILRKGSEQAALPKKRAFKETDLKDFSPPIRPSKVSPKSKSVKTILNIPGFTNELNSKNLTSESESDLRSSPASSKDKYLKGGVIKKKCGINSSAQNLPIKIPRNTSNTTDFQELNTSEMFLSSLHPKDQQVFQQQTVSKAISYTINSLLSNPHNNNNHPLESTALEGRNRGRRSPKSNGIKEDELKPPVHSQCFVKSKHDQNSFLRHLLDTSDPIPNSKTDKESKKLDSPRKSQSPSKDIRHEKKSSKLKIKSQHVLEDKEKHCSTLPTNYLHSPSSVPMNMYPQIAMLNPSLFPGGFPSALQAYESIIGRMPHASAYTAAAAEMQYKALIPPNLFGLNPTMAAAMAAASLLGASPYSQQQQQLPVPGLPSTPIMSRSPTNHQVSSNVAKSLGPLNLSQRGTPENGCRITKIPVPFHAPVSDASHSNSGSLFHSKQMHTKDTDNANGKVQNSKYK